MSLSILARPCLDARKHCVSSALAFFIVATIPITAVAQTLTWDAPPDASVIGYLVQYSRAGATTQTVDVGRSLTYSLTGFRRDYNWSLCVRAYNALGLQSTCSDTVVLAATAAPAPPPTPPPPTNPAPTPAPAPTPTPAPSTYSTWAARFGVGSMTADDDADGATNGSEFTAQTDPTIPNRWLLSEGAGGGYEEDVSVVNPGSDPVELRVTALGAVRRNVTTGLIVSPNSKRTFALTDFAGTSLGAVGLDVAVVKGGAVVERTMSVTGSSSGPVHTGRGQLASSTWYFADGDASTFDTFLLVANPGAITAKVTAEFLPGKGTRMSKTYDVPARGRLSIWCNEIPALAGKTFATTVKSTVPIVAERSMYFWRNAVAWTGGHSSAGAPALSKTWWLADGMTGVSSDTYLMLANPGATAASAKVTYTMPGLASRSETYVVPAAGRTTVLVDQRPGLSSTAVSMAVSASLPIVAERAMFWPATWRDGHSSVGATRSGVKWVIAEGRYGGAESWSSYLAVMNPNAAVASVKVRLLREAPLPPVERTITVAAGQTASFLIDSTWGLDNGESFGAVIEASRPVVVERSMYSMMRRARMGGTNEGATRIK